MISQARYQKAIVIINRYEDDLTSNRYISSRQAASYKAARELEEKYIEQQKAVDKAE